MHLLSVKPDYAGRTRVFINNLEQGGDFDLAYRNAYQKSRAEIEKQLDAYMQSRVSAPRWFRRKRSIPIAISDRRR